MTPSFDDARAETNRLLALLIEEIRELRREIAAATARERGGR